MVLLKILYIWLFILGVVTVKGSSSSESSKGSVEDSTDAHSDEIKDSLDLDESLSPVKDSSEDSMAKDIEKVDLYGPPLDKKWVGDIFGGGYAYKRRDPFVDKALALADYYKSDKSIKLPRLFKQVQSEMKDKGFEYGDTGLKTDAQADSVKNGGFNSEEIESDRDAVEPRPFKRLFGYRLGNGFALGKRSKRSLQQEYPDYLTDDSVASSEDWDDKRYFASDMGGRFGRRSSSEEVIPTFAEDELEDSYPDKRYFHSDLGHRFAFGKRSNWKRYLGHVLGSGFRLGKRGEEDGIPPEVADAENGKEYDEMYFLGPIDMGYSEEEALKPTYYQYGPQFDKRFGHILGHGFRFGKRPDKRYGWVLGRGFMLRKRAPKLDDSIENMLQTLDENNAQKRFGFNKDPRSIKRLGLLLGHGMHLGKRQDGFYNDYYDTPYKREYYSHYKRKPFGHVLGNGFAFGKRTLDDTAYEGGDSEEMLDAEKRAFGHWLGHGFKLGKRSKEYPDDEYDRRDH